MAKVKGATAEQMWKWYEESVAYQTALGLRTSIPECVRFYEGDQWAKPTEGTRHFPRPVINIIELICNNKKSQILGGKVSIVYKPDSSTGDIKRFNRFAEYEQKRMRQADADNKAMLDGIVKGSYCYYYAWDSEIMGDDGVRDGDICLQVIDPLDVHFADPREKDEQKQEWIMIVSRESVEKMREQADSDVNKELIDEDANESAYNEKESDTTKYCTVLTRYFRHDDAVYYERATKEVVFNAPKAHTPSLDTEEVADNAEENETDVEQGNRFLAGKPKATRYPIVFSAYKERNNSIYGRGEVAALIPNQKAINFNWGMQLLASQDEAMGVTIVLPDALKGQEITNEPGQVIVDHSKHANGIKRLPSSPMSKGSAEIADKLTDITRVVSGASEVMNGEVISAGMSGAAIAQLQSQAMKPIEDLQKAFWRSKEKAGEVLEQYMRFFFAGKKYHFIAEEDEDTIQSDEFNSSEYANTRFDVVAEAVAGTVMSEVADINILENLFAKQAISLRTYISCYPDNAIANRQKLLDAIGMEQNDAINQMQAQLEQLKQQLEQAAQVMQAQEKTINNAKTITDESRTLKEMMLALQAEYAQKMQVADKILRGLGQRVQQYYGDAQTMAKQIAEQKLGKNRLGIA